MVNLDKLFYPKSVALIGVSDNPVKGATAFLYALRQVNFPNPIYNVNINRRKVMFNEDAYPSILDIPDEIDYAIIGVPAKDVPQTIKQCSQKGVKFITIFTSGFSELGTEEGREREKALLRNAHGLRIVGPNCIGVFCQESRITATELLEIPEREGKVAFIAQSGGHTGSFYFIGIHRGFAFNKVVSIGNQCDLTNQDFIEYFAKDEKIQVITCYLERIKEPKTFFKILRETSFQKPVIIWKGGQTPEGMLAAASHTGALSSSYPLFKSTVNQHGGILAESMDEFADLTLGALYLTQKKLGKRVGICVPGGGSATAMTDEATRSGLQMPEFTTETRDKIQELIQEVNTNTRNPTDLGVLGWFPMTYSKVLSCIARDPNIDVVLFYFMTERLPPMIARINEPTLGNAFLRYIKRSKKKSEKPFICISPNFIVTDPEITKFRKKFLDGLIESQIPHFPSVERAANVLVKLIDYQKFLTAKH